MKDHKFNEEENVIRTNKKRKKHFHPHKKNKYSLSKFDEYENYLNDLEMRGNKNPQNLA